jgi:hypothetical protein
MHAVEAQKLLLIILNDRKVKLIEIAVPLKISKKRVGHIVHEYLDCHACSQSTEINNVLMIRSNV